MKRLLFIFALFSVMIPMGAQETLMLEDCLRIGIENNLSLKTSRNEVLKGKHTLSENHAKLLPQINAVASAHSIMEFLGKPHALRLHPIDIGHLLR